MYYYRTIDNGELLRIEDEDGSAITLSMYDHVARILSVYVNEDDRREGVGSGLLCAAESEALGRGCVFLEADVSEEQPGVFPFFENNGFSSKEEAPVYKLTKKDVVSSRTIKECLSKTEGSTFLIPLSQLDKRKWEEIFKYASTMRMPIGSVFFSCLSQVYSVAIYDKSGSLIAIIMASEGAGKLCCDLILTDRFDEKYLPSVISDYFMYLQDAEGEKTYDRFDLLATDPYLVKLLKEIYEEKKRKEPVTHTMFCRKKLENADPDVDIYDDEMDWDGSHVFWLKELKDIPLQISVVWHLPWKRSLASVTATAKKRAKINEIKRPFFHKLVIPNEAELLYELRNLEEEEDVVSEIISFRFQSKEAGKRILEEYSQEAAKWKVVTTRLESKELSDWEREVFEESDFVLENRDSDDIVVTVDQILEDGTILGNKVDPAIKPLNAIDERQFIRGVKSCLSFRKKNSLQDFGYLPKEWYENDVSCCIMEGNRVCGFLLIHRESSKRLIPVYMLSMREEASKDILSMMAFSFQAIAEQYPTNTEILIKKRTSEVEKLRKMVCPNASGAPVIFGERKESWLY